MIEGPESWMQCGEERVCMKERELLWFDNKRDHSVINTSKGEHIHLAFDLLPTRPAGA